MIQPRRRYRLDYGPDEQSGPKVCDCCGAATYNVWAYVDEEQGPYAVYYFCFAEGHDHGTMLALVGGWGEGATTARSSACFDVALNAGRLMFRPQPIERMPMQPSAEMLGRVLTVPELEASRELADIYYDLARAGALYDARVRHFLETGQARLLA